MKLGEGRERRDAEAILTVINHQHRRERLRDLESEGSKEAQRQMRWPQCPQPCRPGPRAALWTSSLLSLLLTSQSLCPIIEKSVVFPSTRTQTFWVRLLTVNDTKGSAGPAPPLPTRNLPSRGESLARHPLCQGQCRRRPSDKQGGVLFSSVQFSRSVGFASLRPPLTPGSMPGLPVPHHLPELAQTHTH